MIDALSAWVSCLSAFISPLGTMQQALSWGWLVVDLGQSGSTLLLLPGLLLPGKPGNATGPEGGHPGSEAIGIKLIWETAKKEAAVGSCGDG